MELRIPSGSGSLLDWFGADAGDLVRGSVGGDAAIDPVTPERLDQVLAALGRGDIEYVGVHDGDAFVQAAGEGSGPYALEHHPAPPGVAVAVPAGVTDEAVRFALHGFLARDPGWPLPFPWEALDAPRPAPRGRIGRLFGRG